MTSRGPPHRRALASSRALYASTPATTIPDSHRGLPNTVTPTATDASVFQRPKPSSPCASAASASSPPVTEPPAAESSSRGGSASGGEGWRITCRGADGAAGMDCGVWDRGGVGRNATQPCPSRLTSVHASMSSPVNVTSVDPSASVSVLSAVGSPSASFGVNPTATRAGRPSSRAASAIAEAYCSASPTIMPPSSSCPIR